VVPFERGGNAGPCAVLLLKVGERDTATAIIERANSSLAEYQQMRRWIAWPDLDFPRTATGKPRLSRIASPRRAKSSMDGKSMLQKSKGRPLFGRRRRVAWSINS